MLRVIVAAILILVLAAAGADAGYDEGVAAHDRGDFAAALKEFRPLAERGHAGAQFRLGLMHDKGEGARRDPAMAAQWYRRAADQGHVKAQFMLGLMHIQGQGVTKSAAEAYRWFRKAAEQGAPLAQLFAGVHLEFGDGVKQDAAEAARWYRAAADQGMIEGLYRLGRLHEQGKGVAQDFVLAARLYREAANGGLANAQSALALLYVDGRGVKQSHREAARWLRKAANQGVAGAQFNLGVLYKRGEGVKQNDKTAAKWYREAADQGYPHAQAALGSMYERGDGVGPDRVQAHFWYSLAAAGFPPGVDRDRAGRSRDGVAKGMRPEEIARSQKLARDWKPAVTEAGESAPATRERGPSRGPGTAERGEGATGGRVASGTGFVVSEAGHVLTNQHVIEDCGRVRVRRPPGEAGDARILARDRQADLAVLKIAPSPGAVATFRADPTIRAGDSVVAMGFPLAGLLASEANVTIGAVSALAGLRDDQRSLQMTAPVQPGNSGGPLLDLSGNVVGVVTAGLGLRAVAGATVAVPQNVNFAIKAQVARAFLDANKIPYKSAASKQKLEAADVGDKARVFTVLVECWR